MSIEFIFVFHVVRILQSRRKERALGCYGKYIVINIDYKSVMFFRNVKNCDLTMRT